MRLPADTGVQQVSVCVLAAWHSFQLPFVALELRNVCQRAGLVRENVL